MTGPGALLFDLDGTLVDSVPDLAAAVDATLADAGLPSAGETHVREWVGNGARMLMMRALTWAQATPPGEAGLDNALNRFLEHYSRDCAHRTQVYPGVIPFLERVRDDWQLAVVTNKPERFVRPVLEGTGLSPFFNVCVGGDTLPVCKPDPAPLRHAMSAMKVPAQRTVMIGDSVTDIRAARNADIPVIAVSGGYNHGQPVETAGADRVVKQLDELKIQDLKALFDHKALKDS